MTSDDVTRIHDRLDAISRDMMVVRENSAAVSALCPQHRAAVERVEVTLYGPPGNGHNPGLIGRVADLEGWRRVVRVGLYGLWALSLALGGAALSAWLQ